MKTVCQKCGKETPANELFLQTYGFLWLRVRLVCYDCFLGKAKESK